MEASLSASTFQKAVTEEHSRSEMKDREEKGVSFSVVEKDSHSAGSEALKLPVVSDPSVLQKTNTDCTTGIHVPSSEMSSRSSSSGGILAVSGNNQEHNGTPSSSTNACSNKILSTAGQYDTKGIVPPLITQDPETEENGTSDILSASIQKRVVSNTSDRKTIEAHKESRNDLQKATPPAINNVQDPVGTETTTGISSIDNMNESVIVCQDAELRSELKTTNSTESHKCEFVGASDALDSQRTSSPPATTEKSTIDEAQPKMMKQGTPSSSPRQDNPKSKHNLVSSKGTSSSMHNPSVVLLKQHTLPESSQTAPSASSFLPTRRSSTMGAIPEEGNMEINIQKKSVSANKEADDILASLTSLSQSLTRSTSEGALGAGADGRPNTFQSHSTIASNKSFFGNYPSFPLSSSHKSASTILTGSSTTFVQPGNGVDFGRVSQTAGLGSSAYAALANAVRKNEFSGKNMSSAQMLSGHVLQIEEGYNTYNATTEYSSSFGKKTGIAQERKWAASANDEYHRTGGDENYGNTHRIHADDQVLMLPLECIKSGGCAAASFMNTADGVARVINENGAFQTHVGMSGVAFQTGSTAAAAAAVLAQQESRPLLLTRFEMLEAYAKGRLCLSCDSKSHRMPSCPFGEFVCPNCHRSSHRGEECPLRCRFCQQLHVGISVTVCIKRFRGPLEALLGISLPLRDLQPASLLSMGTPASPLGQAALTRPNSAFGRSVYVSNLPPNTTQETLAAAVDALLTKGRIMQVDLHEKHAFVQLSTLEAAFELVDKRRQLQIRGVTLKVQFKKTGVFNNAMPQGSATVPCALPGGTNTGTTPIASAFSPNTAYNNGNQSGTSAVTPLSAASSPTGAFGAGASPTFSPSLNSLLIFLGPPASPSVSEICAQVAAKLKEDLHMGLVTAQQQSPSVSGGASRTTPPMRLAQCSASQKFHELQQLSGIVSVPLDAPSPQSTTVAALFSAAAAAAANCQASAEGGSASAFSSTVLQRLAPAKNALYNPPSSTQNSALVSAAAQYVANSLLGPSSCGSNDVTRAGIQNGHSTSTKTGSCMFESHAQPSSSIQDAHPDAHSSLAGEKELLLQLLQHEQEKSQHRRKSNVEKSQNSLQQPALLTETLMRAAAAAAGANPVSLFHGGGDGVEGTGTRGGTYARRQVQLQLQQLEELQKHQVGSGSQQRHQTQVSGALDQQLCLQWKKQKQNSGVTQGVCSETRSGQHLANTQGEEQGPNENMTFSQDGIPSPSSGLNLAADNVYNHSTTLSSRAVALKALQGYASIDGSGSAGTVLKNGGGKNGIQMTPFSRSNAESNAMKMLCTNGRKMSNFSAQNVVNSTCASLQHPASWGRIPTGIAATSGSAQETVLSMDPEEEDQHFASASLEENGMGKANFLFEVQQQKQQKNGGGCSGFFPSLLSTESTTMCSQEAAMMATKNPSNRMQFQTGTFHHHSLGVQPNYPEDSDASLPYPHAGAHRNGGLLETREETDELYTSHQHDLSAFLSMSSNSKGLLTGTTKAVGSLGAASKTVTPPVTTSRSAQKASQLSVGAEATDTTSAGVPGSQRSSNSAMVASGEATQQLLDVAATLMHKAVEETTDVEEIAQQLYQTTRDLPQEAVHQLLLTLATSGGQSSPPSTSGLGSTPKKPEDISSTPLNPAATPFLVH
ncbi:proteophosphoglycan 5, related protein [Toxoplasma gondii TgCatPRC2]|uniref:Proteophosphoglycan 5, related protein n=1 Tax=Toxoplasma gondii TgCatPRC2 TaxID=1130821 RepID=A0A151H7Z8_TOXGO|nr:proteophosphoglycan 5, related protein [Toxoplasma gondii TgCatPRC2]